MRLVKSGIHLCVNLRIVDHDLTFVRDLSSLLQAIVGGIGGAVKGIFGPVINIARKVTTQKYKFCKQANPHHYNRLKWFCLQEFLQR